MSESQQYEDYWKLTLEYSDIYEANFNNCLAIIIAFIDKNMYLLKTNPSDAYQKLQGELEQTLPKTDSASTRKSINQFIKLGFANPGLTSYHPEAKEFLEEQNAANKRTIFSKIVYSNASFSRSFSKDSDVQEINFLLKTLSEVGQLTREDVQALMTVDIANVGTDHLDAETLARARQQVEINGFAERKYNQVNYLWNILKKLDDLVVQEDKVYLESDPRVVITDDPQQTRIGRDSYLQRLYKNQLKEESIKLYGKPTCMAEKLDYPALIASHIKPYVLSNEEEAFDANNGLLLSRNMDNLFDQGYITFDAQGKLLVSQSKNLSNEIIEHLEDYSLDARLLNPQREIYLQFHRENVFQP